MLSAFRCFINVKNIVPAIHQKSIQKPKIFRTSVLKWIWGKSFPFFSEPRPASLHNDLLEMKYEPRRLPAIDNEWIPAASSGVSWLAYIIFRRKRPGIIPVAIKKRNGRVRTPAIAPIVANRILHASAKLVLTTLPDKP